MIWIVIHFVLLFLISLVFWFRRSHAQGHKEIGLVPIPSPPSHWLKGHIPLLTSFMKTGKHIDQLIQQLHARLCKARLIKLSLVFRDIVAVFDPDAVKEVCVTLNLPKAPYASIRAFLGGQSILLANGKEWQRTRKAFAPGFNYSHLKECLPDFCGKASTFGDKLEALMNKGDPVPMYPQLILLTIDIICLLVFSQDFNVLDEDHPPAFLTPLRSLIDQAGEFQRKPWLMWMLRTRWPFGIKEKVDAIKVELDSYLTEIIDTRKREMKNSDRKRDILSLAISASESEGETLALESILSQIKTFIFAGHDSSATTISFSLYELSINKEIEARVLDEIREQCGHRFDATGKILSPLTADEVNGLKLLNAVIKEVLRLWPPAGSARIATRETCQSLWGTYAVDHRTVLYLPHYPMHRDEQYWGPDAAVFRPDRWLDMSYVSQLHPYCYTPFSKGPRDCIGQILAVIEAKVVLATLLMRFDFHFAGGVPEDRVYRVTGIPSGGVLMKIKPREV